jgi:hypothetical protein
LKRSLAQILRIISKNKEIIKKLKRKINEVSFLWKIADLYFKTKSADF